MTSENILADTIAVVGLLIAFYYGLTGFACVWFYRKTMWSSPRDILMQGLIPLLGGTILVAAFFWAAKTYADPEYGYTSIGGIGGVFLLGIGSLVLGVVLMLLCQRALPAYFRGETLPKHDATELVLEGGGYRTASGLPDSGTVPIVIAPDLSNLPPGETAVDPLSGEEFTRD